MNLIKNTKNRFLLLKKFKNIESAQLSVRHFKIVNWPCTLSRQFLWMPREQPPKENREN